MQKSEYILNANLIVLGAWMIFFLHPKSVKVGKFLWNRDEYER